MTGAPFEIIGGDAGQCADGVCLPPTSAAVDATGIDDTVTRHGPVDSLDEAAHSPPPATSAAPSRRSGRPAADR